MIPKVAVVLAKDRELSPAQESLHVKLLEALEHRSDIDVTVVPHLYDLSPDGPGVRFLRSVHGDLIVLSWLYPRSAYWVLDANGIHGRLGRTSSLHEGELDDPLASHKNRSVPDRTLWCFDLRSHDQPEKYLAEIDQILLKTADGAALSGKSNGDAKVIDESTRPRWYPVVDVDRCDNCHECLNFCLFGVFGLDHNSSVVIEQPDACRSGCPACSRICPKGAIIFPQHKDPAIAGHDSGSSGGLKLDLSQLFAGVSGAELAAAERRRALAEKNGGQNQTPSDPKQAKAEGPKQDSQLDSLVDGLDNLDL